MDVRNKEVERNTVDVSNRNGQRRMSNLHRFFTYIFSTGFSLSKDNQISTKEEV